MTLDLTNTIIYDLRFPSKKEVESAAAAFQDSAVFVTTPEKVRKEWWLAVYMRSSTGLVERPTTVHIKKITEENGGYIAMFRPRVGD